MDRQNRQFICLQCERDNKQNICAEAYRCLVLLGLIVTFQLGVCRFIQFLSDISTFRCRNPKFQRCSFTLINTEACRCLVLLCSIANLRVEVSRFRDLSQFIDLRYVDFGCFSATFKLYLTTL